MHVTKKQIMSNLRLKADVVLQDCKHSIWEYDLQLQSEELRIKWLCIITLLRAVGHVLLNVDSKNGDNKLKVIIDRRFDEINRHKDKFPIFWKFIKEERDRFLKDYEHGIIRIIRPKQEKRNKGFSISSDVAKSRGGKVLQKDSDEIVSYLSSGPYKGRYEKDVAQEAYKWWKTIIAEIKNEYKNN